jgi:PPK2 family polyphosphate:nucleotide phosphotransferase
MSHPSTLEPSSFRVPPGSEVDLASIDTRDTGGFEGGKKAGRLAGAALTERLEHLQEVLYAQGKHRVLIVLQATDTGGKDGTIRKVFDGVNPQGVKVASFKRPTPEELAHDYLWRVHPHVPANGEMVIFNRSHYEDVLVVRVHGLVPEERWSRRYDHINTFERMLADEGTTILKFFLHISRDEQRARLQARLDDPTKHWKFSLGDLDERKRWNDYQRAFEAALMHTSTEWAPWYVVPADRKWYRDLVVASVLVDTLERLGLEYPPPEDDLTGVVVE